MSVGQLTGRDELLAAENGLQALSTQSYRRVLRAFLRAMDYQDPAVIRSHLTSAREQLVEAVESEIQNRLDWPRLAAESCQRILADFEGYPVENVDDAGKHIESMLDRMIDSLTELRDECVIPLKGGGIEVEGASLLDSSIDELQALKTETLMDWPWSGRPLPPVNRQMIEASRASIARGEGERIEDLIRRLGGSPTRG